MEKWMPPVLEELDVTMTENGSAPATYESDYAGKMEFGGQMWCVVSGFLWESGMDMKGYGSISRPYTFGENGTVFYD